MQTVGFSCACGEVRGEIHDVRPAVATRCVCHCKGCTAYVHTLGVEERFLEPGGGTDVAQISPDAIHFTAGADKVVSLRQTPKGALRWHAGCCNTPLFNTLASLSMPFVGVLLAGLDLPSEERSERFGPVATHLNMPPRSPHRLRIFGLLGMLVRLSWLMLGWRWRRACTPQFDPATLRPLSPPRALDAEERARFDSALASWGKDLSA